jgi:toxin ParE1/3/4
VKRRSVVFAPEAEDDLVRLYDWIAERAGAQVALGYIERIEDHCQRLDLASERGRRRDDIRPGLRIVGFERRVTIAITVDADQVTILRVLYSGADWERALS